LAPAPTAAASFWQCASAPESPPRSAPLPGPAPVMKKIIDAGSAIAGPATRNAKTAAQAVTGTPNRTNFIVCFSLFTAGLVAPPSPSQHSLGPAIPQITCA